MRRREFIAVAAGAAAWPLAGRAQTAAGLRRVGMLSPFSPAETARWNKAFQDGMQALGWVEGKNLAIEYRYAEGARDRLQQFAAELVRLKVDIIVTSVTADTLAAKNATKEIPIVMVAPGDPVAIGLVNSLAKPGENITGLSQMTSDLAGKRLQLLKEIAPALTRAAVLFDAEDPLSVIDSQETRRAAQKLGLEVVLLGVRRIGDLDAALEKVESSRADALVIMPSPVLLETLKRITAFAARHKLPSAFHLRELPAAGGLLSYGVDRPDLFRRAAAYVDKIFKGARPADLPIEQPTKFELVINLNTAKTLGLAVPATLLARADEVIE
jgi:putative ABC transport system substrate-binding protein